MKQLAAANGDLLLQEVVQCSNRPISLSEGNSSAAGLPLSVTLLRTCHGRETKTIDDPSLANAVAKGNGDNAENNAGLAKVKRFRLERFNYISLFIACG